MFQNTIHENKYKYLGIPNYTEENKYISYIKKLN